MARLIDAEELFNKVGKIKPRNEEHYKAIGEFMNMITNSPTIEFTTITTSTDEPVVINYPIIICDDAVSREDARMSLTCEIKENMTITDYISMVDKRLRKLPSVQPSRNGHWIPVSERLPERNKRVIVCYETMEGLKVDTSIFDKYGCLLGKAVAWMPLPEPYKDMRGVE